jgi:hypothetical protein
LQSRPLIQPLKAPSPLGHFPDSLETSSSRFFQEDWDFSWSHSQDNFSQDNFSQDNFSQDNSSQNNLSQDGFGENSLQMQLDTVPNITIPNTTNPNITVPNTTTPNTNTPNTTTPNTTTPNTTTPNTSTPNTINCETEEKVKEPYDEPLSEQENEPPQTPDGLLSLKPLGFSQPLGHNSKPLVPQFITNIANHYDEALSTYNDDGIGEESDDKFNSIPSNSDTNLTSDATSVNSTNQVIQPKLTPEAISTSQIPILHTTQPENLQSNNTFDDVQDDSNELNSGELLESNETTSQNVSNPQTVESNEDSQQVSLKSQPTTSTLNTDTDKNISTENIDTENINTVTSSIIQTDLLTPASDVDTNNVDTTNVEETTRQPNLQASLSNTESNADKNTTFSQPKSEAVVPDTDTTSTTQSSTFNTHIATNQADLQTPISNSTNISSTIQPDLQASASNTCIPLQQADLIVPVSSTDTSSTEISSTDMPSTTVNIAEHDLQAFAVETDINSTVQPDLQSSASDKYTNSQDTTSQDTSSQAPIFNTDINSTVQPHLQTFTQTFTPNTDTSTKATSNTASISNIDTISAEPDLQAYTFNTDVSSEVTTNVSSVFDTEAKNTTKPDLQAFASHTDVPVKQSNLIASPVDDINAKTIQPDLQASTSETDVSAEQIYSVMPVYDTDATTNIATKSHNLPASGLNVDTNNVEPNLQAFLLQLKPLGIHKSVALTSNFITPKLAESEDDEDDSADDNADDNFDNFSLTPDSISTDTDKPVLPSVLQAKQSTSTPDLWSDVSELLHNSSIDTSANNTNINNTNINNTNINNNTNNFSANDSTSENYYNIQPKSEPWKEQFDFESDYESDYESDFKSGFESNSQQPSIQAQDDVVSDKENDKYHDEELISPWTDTFVSKQYVEGINLSESSEISVSNPQNFNLETANLMPATGSSAKKIDEQQFEQLAQIVYKLIRFQFSLQAERYNHIYTGHQPWINTINCNHHAKNEQQTKGGLPNSEILPNKHISLLTQEVFRHLKIQLEIAMERQGVNSKFY